MKKSKDKSNTFQFNYISFELIDELLFWRILNSLHQIHVQSRRTTYIEFSVLSIEVYLEELLVSSICLIEIHCFLSQCTLLTNKMSYKRQAPNNFRTFYTWTTQNQLHKRIYIATQNKKNISYMLNQVLLKVKVNFYW